MEIAGREIGAGHPPYIIAELSGNHNGSLDRAIEIIKVAKESGADAMKLQTYRAETMTLDVDHPRFKVNGGSPWDGDHLFDLYNNASTPWEWHETLFNVGKEIGITVFSSPFDFDAIELLEGLDAPAYKIASFELVDLELIARCASTGKPLIMSTGMASIVEISEAVETARKNGAKEIALLKCTSAYPAPYNEMNLRTIPHLSQTFDVISGLSDHTLGIGVSIAATALGAHIIEKHVTLARADGGVDSTFSLEPAELTLLVSECKNAYESLGEVTYVNGDTENSFRQFRRSLFFVRDVSAGSVIVKDDIAAIRPGDGLVPKYKQAIIGRVVKNNVQRGTPVSWECLV